MLFQDLSVMASKLSYVHTLITGLSDFAPPKSTTLSPYVNPEVDRLIEQSEIAFDPAERDRILAKVNEIVVEDAPWIFIVHDLNPRALSPRVKGFVQAQSWYQDLTLPWPKNDVHSAHPRASKRRSDHHQSTLHGSG
jgi:ABC-type transport system substrate-binding protein